jgi:hypothetical protein
VTVILALCYNFAEECDRRTPSNNKSSINVSDHLVACRCFCNRAKSILWLYELNGTKDPIMICPGTTVDCDNPGCRRGGCQGRPPELPLFQAARTTELQAIPEPPVLTLLQAAAERTQPLAA